MSRDARKHRRTVHLIGALCLALAGWTASGCGDDADDGQSGAGGGGGSDDHTGHGDHADHAGGDGGGDGGVGCGLQENCIDTVELAEGLEAEGEDGVFSVRLLEHNTLAPMGNEWLVEILDADGNRVQDATVIEDVLSVDCGHGGPDPAQDLSPNEDGTYDVMPTTVHAGPWDVYFTIMDGDDMDEVYFHLCIPGEGHTGSHE